MRPRATERLRSRRGGCGPWRRAGGSARAAAAPETRHRGGDPGFTLIEVLVTLVILATGLVVVLQTFQTSAVALGDARDVLRATRLAAARLAEVEAAGGTPAAGEGVFPDPDAAFRWRLEAAPEAGRAGDLWRVTVDVWRDSGRGRQTVVTYMGAVPP